MNNVVAPRPPEKDKPSNPMGSAAQTGNMGYQSSTGNSALSSGASSDTSQPEVDFVLVFEAVPKRYQKVGKVPAAQKSAIAREYEKLVERIEDVGLQVTSREGKPKSGQVLLFVRGNDSALVKIGKEEK